MSYEDEKKKRFLQEVETLLDASHPWLIKLPWHEHEELLNDVIDLFRRYPK